MPQVHLRDTDLHYEEAGAGEPLVLLHGGLGTAQLHFWREIAFFAGRYHVLAPDLRGYGRSSPPRTFPTDFYYRDAADITRFVDQLGLGPVHLAGWSDGGVIALIVAIERPDLVRSLVTWGAQARITSEERAGWVSLADPSSWTEGARRRFIEAQGESNWPKILQRMLDGYHRFYDAHEGDIVSHRVGSIQAPTLILHGGADAVVPVLHAEELGRTIPGARVQIFDGAGHALHRDREAELRRQILDFLAHVSSQSDGA